MQLEMGKFCKKSVCKMKNLRRVFFMLKIFEKNNDSVIKFCKTSLWIFSENINITLDVFILDPFVLERTDIESIFLFGILL